MADWIKYLLLGVFAVISLAFPIRAAAVSYPQDGFPYLANGTATSGVAFINIQDDASYNITEALTNSASAEANLVLNGNFTGGSGANWAYTEFDPSGRAISNFLLAGGDTEPGVWNFRVGDNNPVQSFAAHGNLTNDGASWDGSLPSEAIINFSFRKAWAQEAPTTNDIIVFLLKPDGSRVPIWGNSTIYSSSDYSRVSIAVGPNNFTQAGTYRIMLFNYVISPAGRSTIDNYWDQISLTLKKPSNFYALGVWHNSSAIVTPANLNDVTGINVTLRFMANSGLTPALQIFNFASGIWSAAGCTPSGAISANTWHLWNCDIPSSPLNFISTDGNKKIRIRLMTPLSDNSQTGVSEDLLNFTIFYSAAPVAFVNSDRPAYSACGTVFYAVKLFDKDEQPYLQQAQANISISNSTSILEEKAVSISGGAFYANFTLPFNANSGNWMIRALSGALGKKYFHVGSGNSDVWKIGIIPSITKGAYLSGDIIPTSINVFNLMGVGVNGLVSGGNLLLFRDASIYSPIIISHGNGTYSFNLDFASLTADSPHKLTVIANSSGINLSSSFGFYVA